MRRFSLFLVFPWILLLSAPLFAGATLTLQDGQVLKGTDLQRKGSFYILHLATGGFITLPVDVVKEFALTDEGEPDGAPALKNQATGSPVQRILPDRRTESEEETADESPPETAPPVLPGRQDMIDPLGKKSSVFRNGVVDPNWTPSSDWDMDTERNNFRPTRWSESPLDPSWNPTSWFSDRPDSFDGRSVHWQRSVVDNGWTPSDGFQGRKSSSFLYTEETVPLVNQESYRPKVDFEVTETE